MPFYFAFSLSSPTDCVCVGWGWGESGRVREREETERTSGLWHSMRVFNFFNFVSCNWPCVPMEEWHRKEHIIINASFFAGWATAPQ